jgi:hypothetical protein
MSLTLMTTQVHSLSRVLVKTKSCMVLVFPMDSLGMCIDLVMLEDASFLTPATGVKPWHACDRTAMSFSGVLSLTGTTIYIPLNNTEGRR